MDLLGAFFLICSIVCLLLALQWGGITYAWSNSKVYGNIIGFGLLISTFTGIQFWKGEKATLPPRIMLRQRTVFTCAFFSAFLAMALYTHIYYSKSLFVVSLRPLAVPASTAPCIHSTACPGPTLSACHIRTQSSYTRLTLLLIVPFYFQAVKGTSAEGSGIRTIPYLVSNTLAAIVVGGLVTWIGYYVPFTWIGSAIFTVGAGMIYTWKVNSPASHWIGYQLMAGIGSGACVQLPFIAIQVVLSKKDMPIGNAVGIFFNSLGGAISISIAQNIFSNTLIKEIPKHAPRVDPMVVMMAGATHVREVVSPGQLEGVLFAYNKAVTSSFVLAIACGGMAFAASWMFEWKSVKGKKLEIGGGA
jgi:hypothetical protein